MSDYKSCERCGDQVLAGDVLYIENTGQEVCEYCYDYIMEENDE